MKAAVVGVGYLGAFHAEKYSKSSGVELAAVVDVRPERAKEIAKKFKCQALTDYRDLPGLGVQCASVAADTGRHFEIAGWLLRHGVDVLVEKPIATSTAEAKELIALAALNNRILQVGHLERFNPAFRTMERFLTRPVFFEARRIAQFAGRGHDVDVVLDLMIHDIDIIAHIVKRPIRSVEAIGVPIVTKSFDIANARLTFEGGAVANVSASRAAFKSERSLRVFQPNVYLSLDFGNKKLKVYTKEPGTNFIGLPKISTHEETVEERDALRDQIEAFIASVRDRTPPIVPGEDGLLALELAEQIKSALRRQLRMFADGGEGNETLNEIFPPEALEFLREDATQR